MGVVIRGKTFKLIGEVREENVHIQCFLVLLEKGRWEQGNGSVLGEDCRKCAAEEIS
jgi:hypothetical protein